MGFIVKKQEDSIPVIRHNTYVTPDTQVSFRTSLSSRLSRLCKNARNADQVAAQTRKILHAGSNYIVRNSCHRTFGTFYMPPRTQLMR